MPTNTTNAEDKGMCLIWKGVAAFLCLDRKFAWARLFQMWDSLGALWIGWIRLGGNSSREGDGNPLQHSCLESPMDGGAWKAAVHGVAKSRTRLSDFTFTFHFHALEKAMATHSSVLAWRIPGTGVPDGLPSMGSHRVRHNWSDLAAAAAATLHLGSGCWPCRIAFLRKAFSDDLSLQAVFLKHLLCSKHSARSYEYRRKIRCPRVLASSYDKK